MSSLTREASSIRIIDTAEKPRTVASDPGQPDNPRPIRQQQEILFSHRREA